MPNASAASNPPLHTGQSINTKLQIGGSARYRYENKQNFQFGAPTAANSQDYWLQQLRLHMLWNASSKVHLFVEIQDARIFQGFQGHVINQQKTPNIFEDHLDIHQAYLDIFAPIGDMNTRIRMGRQKFNLGAQRMMASLEWVNTARVWDGIRITSHISPKQTLDVFGSRLVPVNPQRANNHSHTPSRMFNSALSGVYYTDAQHWLTHTQLEFYALLREEASFGDRVYTWGHRAAYQQQAWDADYEIMVQTGTYGHQTQRAHAAHIGIGYQLENLHTHIATAYNIGSGDSNPNDNIHQTFDNQYPLNHAYYGYMDFFSLQNMQNLEFVAQTQWASTWQSRIAWQSFWLLHPTSDAWYHAGAGVLKKARTGAAHQVGNELDITLKHKLTSIPGTLYMGYSHFFTGAYLAQTNTNKAADFAFAQVKLVF